MRNGQRVSSASAASTSHGNHLAFCLAFFSLVLPSFRNFLQLLSYLNVLCPREQAPAGSLQRWGVLQRRWGGGSARRLPPLWVVGYRSRWDRSL